MLNGMASSEFYGRAIRSIMARWKHKILMVPFNSAIKTTYKNQVFKYSAADKNIEVLSLNPQ